MPYREAGEWLRVRDASFGVHTPAASPGSISVRDKTPHSCQSLFSHLETGVDHLDHKGRLGRESREIIHKQCLVRAGPGEGMVLFMFL